jgi:hypothetical protein
MQAKLIPAQMNTAEISKEIAAISAQEKISDTMLFRAKALYDELYLRHFANKLGITAYEAYLMKSGFIN